MYTYLECVRCGKLDALAPAALELVDMKKDYLCYPCESSLSALDADYYDCVVCGAHESVKRYEFNKTVYCSKCGQRYDVVGDDLEPYFTFSSEPAVLVARVICELAYCRLEHAYKLITALRRLFGEGDAKDVALLLEGLDEIAEESKIHDDYVVALKGAKERL
jgi:transcription elongation factor Elf1